MNNNFKHCRVCLENGDNFKLMSIFENNSELARKLFLLTGVKIIELGSFEIHALICSRCIIQLQQSWNFRMVATTTDNLVRRKMLQIEINLWTLKIRSRSEPIAEQIHNKLSSSPTEFDFTIKTEPEEFVCNPVDLAVVQNVEMFKNFSEETKIKEEKFLEENLQNDVYKIFKCDFCKKKFKLKKLLDTHIRKIHGYNDKELKPKKTRKKPEPKKTLKKEVNHCEPCKKVFTTKKSFLDHKKIRHDYVDPKDMYICDHCGKMQKIKYYLIRHIQVVHFKIPLKRRNLPEAVPCEICGKIIKDRYTMKQHLESHRKRTADDYYYCDLCPRKFKNKGECFAHIRERHIFKKTYPCEHCPGVVYYNKWHLKCHIKSRHTNIREFKCEYCEKRFMDKQKVQIHTRIHTGERPHKCSFEGCNRDFIHQTDLRRHIWGHTGERPYKCSLCTKGFMKNSELLHHHKRCHQNFETFK